MVVGGGVGTSRKVEEVEKGHGRVNIVQIVYTYVCKWKNNTCLNCSRNGRRFVEGLNSSMIYLI
jgi:hypothetical protein